MLYSQLCTWAISVASGAALAEICPVSLQHPACADLSRHWWHLHQRQLQLAMLCLSIVCFCLQISFHLSEIATRYIAWAPWSFIFRRRPYSPAAAGAAKKCGLISILPSPALAQSRAHCPEPSLLERRSIQTFFEPLSAPGIHASKILEVCNAMPWNVTCVQGSNHRWAPKSAKSIQIDPNRSKSGKPIGTTEPTTTSQISGDSHSSYAKTGLKIGKCRWAPLNFTMRAELGEWEVLEICNGGFTTK